MDSDFFVLFGASGQIGSALVERLESRGLPWVAVPWSALADIRWVDEPSRSREALERHVFSKVPSGRKPAFAFASGLTDPRLPESTLREANVEFPWRAIMLGEQVFGERARFLTLGTIHENFDELCQLNPYFRAKRELGERMLTGARGRYVHARLHTVYGGSPKPHMFLGQMAAALRRGAPFAMSAGEQLREYHHVDDLSEGLLRLLVRGHDGGAVIELSSGEPVRLVDLARGVFAAFGAERLLKVGAIEGQASENHERRFARVSPDIVPRFRPTIPGVIESLRKYVEN